MAESRTDAAASSCFKEAVCVDVQRVYDSCSDKDCLSDMRVHFTECDQALVNSAVGVRGKSIELLDMFVEVEPIPFNRGFYSVDMTYFFLVKLAVFANQLSPPAHVTGIAVFNKKVILYGSEGGVRIYSSDRHHGPGPSVPRNNLPVAKVQIVDPILLSAKLVDACCCQCDNPVTLPDCVSCCLGGAVAQSQPEKLVLVTVGTFSVVQLERSVQMLIPAYDFCVPSKECVSSSDDPCEMFRKIRFPTNDFFPPKLTDLEKDCGCERRED